MSYLLQQKHHTYINHYANRLAHVWLHNSATRTSQRTATYICQLLLAADRCKKTVKVCTVDRQDIDSFPCGFLSWLLRKLTPTYCKKLRAFQVGQSFSMSKNGFSQAKLYKYFESLQNLGVRT